MTRCDGRESCWCATVLDPPISINSQAGPPASSGCVESVSATPVNHLPTCALLLLNDHDRSILHAPTRLYLPPETLEFDNSRFKYYASPVRGAPRHSVATKGTPVLHANESPTLESVGPFTLRTPSFFGENTFLGALVT